MRILALARYRLLRTVRTAHWVFAVALIAAAFPVVWGSDFFAPAHTIRLHARGMAYQTAFMVPVTYMLHLFILIAASSFFSMRRRTPEGREVLDLTETVPATSSDRFFGDAAGILGTLLAVHVCVLPMLGLAVILSPLPASVFFWLEAATLALAVLMSAGTAGNLHARSKWQQTQLARSMVTFLVLAVVILRLTTQWQSFADAAWFSFAAPSPGTWKAVPPTITSPQLLLVSMFLLYAAFLTWFAARSVRFLEGR